MKLEKEIVKVLNSCKIKYKSFNQLFLYLSDKTGESVDNIAKCVNHMIKDGLLVETSKHQIDLAENFGLKKGILCGTTKGFAFVRYSNKGAKKGEFVDFFVPAGEVFGALDGDEVMFKINGKDSATIVKVLKRGNSLVVGKVVDGKNPLLKNKHINIEDTYVICDNVKFAKPIVIHKNDLKNAKVGDKVVVDLVYQPEGNGYSVPSGRVKEILIGDEIENCITSLLVEHGISDRFPQEVIDEAEQLKTDFEKEKARRTDLTNKLIFTIDGDDAKDLDDAVSVDKTENGYVLGVHIADVGEYVKYDNAIDKEAFARGTSVYFPGRVYPMLPEKLSNDLCSLNSGTEKLALSVEMTLNEQGLVKSYRIFESVIKSSARLTYDQVFDVICDKSVEMPKTTQNVLSQEDVKAILEDNKNKTNITREIKESILLMNELSKKVQSNRIAQGSLDLDLPETYFAMDGNNVLDVCRRDRNDAHRLIENFMILCNETVAKCFCMMEIPFVYRVHDKPSKVRVNETVEVINGFGLNVRQKGDVTPKYIQNILEQLKEKDYADIASSLILRSLEKAVYSEECRGHFGLALDYYCHFTSPIRRYPDLTIHRIIKRACKYCVNGIINSGEDFSKIIKNFRSDYDLEEFVVDASQMSSDRERKADEAERDSDDLFKAKFMEDKVGEIFEGKVSGLTNFGVFVEFPNTVEGMIKVETLPADDYKYDPKKFILKGRKHKFSIGDKVTVLVTSANIETRKIDLLLKTDK